MPVIVVLPGIAAYFLYQQGDFQSEMMKGGKLAADNAYPVLLNLLPTGLKGLSFAALTAAIVASLAGKTNSIATIFTLDIYKKVINKNADEKQQVKIGKVVVVSAMLIAVIIAPYLGIDKGGLNYIQEYTGFVSPGIFAMFIMGFFWKRTTSSAALFATIGGFLFSVLLKFLPQLVDLSPLATIGFSGPNAQGIYEIPFMDRMGFVFLFCIAGMYIISIAIPKSAATGKGLEVDTSLFKTDKTFLAGSLLILGILVALYSVFW
jgi:SSS family solute:Na+ symporter